MKSTASEQVIGALPASGRRGLSVSSAGARRGARRLGLLSAVAVAAGGAWAAGDPAPILAVDPELATLLRGMAALKLLILLPTLAAVLWRVGQPVATPFVVGYGLGLSAMAGGATLVWQLSHLGMASIAFHAGLVASAWLAWQDGHFNRSRSS